MITKKLLLIRHVKAFVISTFVLPLSGAMAATYYVDSVAGSDSNPGTSSAAPWATLTKVNGISFAPGDQVLFKRGSSWTGTLVPGGQGTAANPIVFDAYGTGSPPHISGGGSAAAVHIWNKMYFTLQNFEITNDAASNGTRCGIRLSYSSLTYPVYSGVKILNNDIHHVRGISNRDAGIYNNAAIYVDMIASTRVDGLQIEGNYIHDITCIGIYVKPGPYFNIHPEVWATNMIIRDNVLDKTGADHIVVGGADAPLIEGNAGYDGGINGSGYGWIAGMWSAYYCKDPLFQFNEVARMHNELASIPDGDSQAFDCDLGAVGTNVFQYNYSHDNKGGVLIMMYENEPKTVVFRYNISVNDDRKTGSQSQLSIYPILGVNSAHIYNNVFYTTLASGYMIRNTQATYIYNNIFHTPYAEYGSKPWYSNNCYYGHANTPTDPYKITSDPKFVGPLTALDGDTTVGGYQLKPNSPLINAGMTIANNGGFDYWGNPLYAGGFADIGAHEVVGGGALPPAPVTIIDAAPSASVVYTGAWTHSTDANYQSSTKSVSSTIGNYVQYTFTGTNIALYGPKDTGIGKLNISIDGGPATLVDGYVASGGGVRKELFKVTGLSAGSHTIRATVALKNPASATNNVGIDYFQIDPPAQVTVDNTPSASVTYSGSWTHSADANYYNSTKSVSGTVGNYVQFAFTGTGVSLSTSKASGIGKLSISIDGGTPVVVDGYSPTAYYQVPIFQVSGLAPGAHTIRATIAPKNPLSASNNIGIDSFRYQP